MDAMTLPDGYRMRAPTFDDAAQIAAVIGACQRADGDPETVTAAEIINDWTGVDLASQAVVVAGPRGEVAGYADLVNRQYVQISVYGYVDPAHRGRGVGAALVGWGERWARGHIGQAPPEARVAVQHFVRETGADARGLLEAHGYRPIRTHYVMEIQLGQDRPAPEWPEGIGVRTFVPGEDEQAVFEAGEEAFRDMWNRPPSTLERWMQPTRSPGFDPTVWFLAEEQASRTLVGVCLCMQIEGRAHINSVGVRRPWRRRGVGLALLRHAFAAFRERGLSAAELSVDAESSTGAPQLYREAGMYAAKSFVRYAKELRPGVDLA